LQLKITKTDYFYAKRASVYQLINLLLTRKTFGSVAS